MGARDVLFNLGDAIAGVDRTGAFIKGQQARADLDSTQAQTENAMELAKQRRVEAELQQQVKDARDRLQAGGNSALVDPTKTSYLDIMLGNVGSDFSGAMSGRNSQQEFQQRQTVATPAVDAQPGMTLGDDIVTEDVRRAAMDALAPSAAIASRRPRAPGAPVIVMGEDNQPVYVTQEDAPGQRPAPRPVAPRPATPTGPTTQQRNIDDLKNRGVPEDLAIRVVYGEVRDPRAAYTQLYNALRRNFASDEEAAAEANQLVDNVFGAGALDAAQDPLIDDGLTDEYAEGEELTNPATGQTIVLRNGVWVDAETGQPVQ